MNVRVFTRKVKKYFKEKFSKREEFNVWTLKLNDKEQNREFYEAHFRENKIKIILFLLLNLSNFVVVAPKLFKSEREELALRWGAQLTLPLFAIAYFLRKKFPTVYEIALPCMAFIRSGTAVWLRINLLNEGKKFDVNPMYMTIF